MFTSYLLALGLPIAILYLVIGLDLVARVTNLGSIHRVAAPEHRRLLAVNRSINVAVNLALISLVLDIVSLFLNFDTGFPGLQLAVVIMLMIMHLQMLIMIIWFQQYNLNRFYYEDHLQSPEQYFSVYSIFSLGRWSFIGRRSLIWRSILMLMSTFAIFINAFTIDILFRF